MWININTYLKYFFEWKLSFVYLEEIEHSKDKMIIKLTYFALLNFLLLTSNVSQGFQDSVQAPTLVLWCQQSATWHL